MKVKLWVKKPLCLLFCVLGILFFVLWGVTCFALKLGDEHIPSITTVMVINVAVIGVSMIIGCEVVDVSIDQWYPGDECGFRDVLEKVILVAVVLVALALGGMFALTILYHNSASLPLEGIEGRRLWMLALMVLNTFMSYAYYQHLRVLMYGGKPKQRVKPRHKSWRR